MAAKKRRRRSTIATKSIVEQDVNNDVNQEPAQEVNQDTVKKTEIIPVKDDFKKLKSLALYSKPPHEIIPFEIVYKDKPAERLFIRDKIFEQVNDNLPNAEVLVFPVFDKISMKIKVLELITDEVLMVKKLGSIKEKTF